MTSNHSATPPAPDALADRLARLGRGVGVDGRQAVLPDPLRVFHQRLLGAFLTGTGPPDAPVVAGLAAELGLDLAAAQAALAAADLVHTDPEAADTYRRARPDMIATLFGQAEAVQAARRAFGGLLDPAHPQETAP
jgi:hypothetical protein